MKLRSVLAALSAALLASCFSASAADVVTPWWQSPGVVATNSYIKTAGDAGLFKSDWSGDFIAAQYGMIASGIGTDLAKNAGFCIFKASEFVAGDDAAPVFSMDRVNTEAHFGMGPYGATVSSALKIALVSSGVAGQPAISIPLDKVEPLTVADCVVITNDQDYAFGAMGFSADGSYLYTEEYAGTGKDNTKVARWSVIDGLKVAGKKLVLDKEYSIGTRVRNLQVVSIGGKDLVYCLLDGTSGVVVLDPAANDGAGSVTTLLAANPEKANYGGITVSGYATATPTLVIATGCGGAAASLTAYALAADGLSLASETPLYRVAGADFAALVGSDRNYSCDVMGSADDSALIYGGIYTGTKVLKYVAPVEVVSADGETTTGYASLGAAFAAVQDGETVRLLKDVSGHARYEGAGSFTLDLNGKTWSYSFDEANWTALRNAGTGTITVTGNGVIDATDGLQAIALWASSGKIVVNNGTFKVNGTSEVGYVNGTGTLEVLGGTLLNLTTETVAPYGDVLNVQNDYTLSAIQVKGGTFSKNPALGDDYLGGTFVAAGYESKADGDYWTVTALPPVAKIGDVEYTDLRTALTSATKGQTVELLRNVDLNGAPWEPVVDFPANFDGKGFEIQNLVITNGHSRTGLITMYTWGTPSGTIKNITLRNVDVTGESYVGTIVGNNTASGIISNITVCGTIKVSGGWWVGGIAGHAEYGKIVDCHVNGSEGSFIGREGAGQVGGIFGMISEGSGNVIFDSTVSNIKLLGSSAVGGIGGRNHYSSRQCNNSVSDVVIQSASLTNELNTIGGIVGQIYKGTGGVFLNCKATNVTLKDADGKVVAYRDYGTSCDQAGYNFLMGAATGEKLVYNQSNYQLTNGLVTVHGADTGITMLADMCKPGYGLVATETPGTWKIENVTPIVATLKGKNTANITLPNPMPTPGQTLKFTMKSLKSGCVWVAFVNGKKATVSGSNVSYVTDPSETEAEIYVAQVKSTAWYLEPFAKNTLNYGYAYSSLLSDAVMDENDEFLFLGENQHQANNTNIGCYQYKVADIKGYVGAYYGVPVTGTTKIWSDAQNNFRRLMPSAAHKALFVGSGFGAGTSGRIDNCSVFPFSADWGDPKYGGTTEGDARYYIEQSDIGTKVDQWQRVDPGCFSADGKYFYAGCYARRQISKVEVIKNEAGKIVLLRPCGSSITEVPVPLTDATTENGIRWPLTDATKPMGMTMSVFNNEEIVYASLANGDLVMLNGSGDTALGEEDNGERTYTVLGSFGADYFISMRVTGKKAGLPHLICQTKGGNTYVFELADDGKALVSTTPIFKFNAQTDLANLYNPQTGFWHVTTVDDESVAFANYRGGSDGMRSMVATLEKRPSKMTVRTTLGTYEEGTSEQATWNKAKTTVVTATPGRKLLSVKVNGIAVPAEEVGESAYTNTVAALTQNLFIEAVEGYVIPDPVIAGKKGTVSVDNVGKDVAASGTVSGRITGITKGFTALVTVGGVPVALGSDGKFSAPASNGAQVMVAFVKADAWYLDPFVKNAVFVNKCYHSSPLADVALTPDAKSIVFGLDTYNYYSLEGMDNGLYQLNTAAFSSYVGSYLGTPENMFLANKNKGYLSGNYEGMRSVIPLTQGIVVGPQQGNLQDGGKHVHGENMVFPLGGNWGGIDADGNLKELDDRYFLELPENDLNNGSVGAFGTYGLQWTIAGVQSTDGKSAYIAFHARNEITKAMIGTDSATGKITLKKTGVFWRTWDVAGVNNAHNATAIALYNNGTKDIVYASLADGRLVMLDEENMSGNTYNNAKAALEGEPATVSDHAMIELANLSTYGSIRAMKVTGVSAGTPHLIVQIDSQKTLVFALATDGSLVSATPIAEASAVAAGSVKEFQSITALDDESMLVGNYHNSGYYLATITAKPVNVIVRSTFTTYEEGVNTEVAYGVSASKTFNAPAGKKITAVKVNGVADKNFTDDAYTFTDEALVKNVYIEMTTEDKTYDVTLMDGEAVYYTTNIVYNTTVDKPADPVKEGFTFKGWTNETYTTAFDFATPITADLTLFAWYEVAVGPTPTDPEKPTEYKDEKAAADAAAAINADKKNLIKSPYEMSSAVKATYVGYFTAVVDGKTVVVVMNSEGTNAVVTAEQAAGEAALTAVLGTDEESATLDVEAPLAGFYYSLKQNAAVDKLDYATEGDKNKLGGRDAISFSLDKSASSGFYQMIVTPTQVK